MYLDFLSVEPVNNRIVIDIEYDQEFADDVAIALNKKRATNADVQRFIMSVLDTIDWDEFKNNLD